VRGKSERDTVQENPYRKRCFPSKNCTKEDKMPSFDDLLEPCPLIDNDKLFTPNADAIKIIYAGSG